jgi:flagellin-like protein
MPKKGISPLVAAVLLIAVTMTIAGILAFWTTSFVRTHTEQFERESEKVECRFADFEVFSCSYNSTSKKITLILRNVRDIDLKNVTTFVIYQNESVIPESGYALGLLKANTLKTFKLANVSSDYKELLITTHCSPEVEVKTTC